MNTRQDNRRGGAEKGVRYLLCSSTRRAAARQKVPDTFFGFTLVELLVVIVIIGILVSILVPAVAAVRKTARDAATRAAITSIGTGLETFKADAKLGGFYPYSRTDRTDGLVKSPYTNVDIQITGAGLLVWALSGADLLGTPGFQTVAPMTAWGQCTGSDPATPTDTYTLYEPGTAREGQPVFPRSGPYVDQSKLKVTRREAQIGSSAGFVIPEEYRYTQIAREYPMYLDAYGYPILYYRADPAGRWFADVTPDLNTRGVYHCGDNRALVQNLGNAEPPLVLNKAREAHALDWGSSGNACTYTLTAGSQPPPGTFERFIQDLSVQARLWPQRADSYLLVSPGADGLYGTADDVTNFQPNGR
jgi:prepilin-type N-terminal cleavage/methylation domain-containing protein